MSVRNLIEILIRGEDQASGPINEVANNLANSMGRVADNLTNIGAQATVATAPISGLLGVAVREAISFQETMTNVGAIMGASIEEMADLNAQILAIGQSSRAGPQAAAEAFAEVVGGVANAANHIPIFTEAIALAEAGQANLQAATSGLISVMNAYGLEASEATRVSDIFTQTVGMGVGSMDEFVSALGPIAGVAASVGVDFEQLGTAAAYMTTQGFSASASATRLQQAIVALTKPNTQLIKLFQQMGVESGSALIQQEGLAGALRMVYEAADGSVDVLGAALGSTEALGAALAVIGDDFLAFSEEFSAGIEGATASARAIQLESFAAQWDLLMSNIRGVAIQIGDALLPRLAALIGRIRPIVTAIGEWVAANPDLIAGIGGILGVIVAIGPALLGVGQAINFISFAVSGLTSPIGLVIGALAALKLAWDNNFLGIQEIVGSILQQVSDAFTYLSTTVIPMVANAFVEGGILGALEALFMTFEDGSSHVRTFIASLLGIEEAAADQFARPILELGQQVIDFIRNTIVPGLQQLANWFLTDALPLVVDFIQSIVVPVVERFIEILGSFWESVQPGLQALFDWFVNTALPTIVNFIQNAVIPVINFLINLIADIWEIVAPALGSLFSWFMENGLPLITDAINNVVVPAIQGLINILQGIWEVIRPFVESFVNGMVSAIQTILSWVSEAAAGIVDLIGKIQNLSNVWGGIQSNVNIIGQGLASGKWDLGDVFRASVSAIGKQFGFRSGGFTGTGPSDGIAGVTHFNEYVVPEDGALVLRGGGDTYEIYVTMPESALADPQTARARGNEFGEAIKRKLRSRG